MDGNEKFDQCKFCPAHGDAEHCRKSKCSVHSSWYAKALKSELAEARAKLALAEHRLQCLAAEVGGVPCEECERLEKAVENKRETP